MYNDGEVFFGFIMGTLLGVFVGAIFSGMISFENGLEDGEKKAESRMEKVIEQRQSDWNLERACILKPGIWEKSTRTCTVSAK